MKDAARRNDPSFLPPLRGRGTAKRWKGRSVGRLDIRSAPRSVRYNCRVTTRQFRYIALAGNSRCACGARTGERNRASAYPSRRASRATYRMIPGRDHISKVPKREALFGTYIELRGSPRNISSAPRAHNGAGTPAPPNQYSIFEYQHQWNCPVTTRYRV